MDSREGQPGVVTHPMLDPTAAEAFDQADTMAGLRDEFHFPARPDGEQATYLVGNSLGLAPKRAATYVGVELDRWADLGVAGHFTGDLAWAGYHELLTDQLSMIVGGHRDEVVAMNALTVNLHLMMISFFQPTPSRHKILIEEHAFPSDHFAVQSQITQRGYDPASSLELLSPRPGAETLEPADIIDAIDRRGSELALVLLPGVQYFTGQVLPMAEITRAAHDVGAIVGFDLAHAAGNVILELHDWGVDFAVWCSYKYLNGGPGGVGGAFVNNRHIADQNRPKLLGWWGTKAETRFEMSTSFEAIPTVESWQLSNAPVLAMAALRASLDVFDEAGGMTALRAKTERQVAFMDGLLDEVIGDRLTSLTPRPLAERGCQYALRVTGGDHDGKAVFAALQAAGFICDWRHPDVIRAAPVPLYNSFEDIRRFVAELDRILR